MLTSHDLDGMKKAVLNNTLMKGLLINQDPAQTPEPGRLDRMHCYYERLQNAACGAGFHTADGNDTGEVTGEKGLAE
jgi:hypothetical protein